MRARVYPCGYDKVTIQRIRQAPHWVTACFTLARSYFDNVYKGTLERGPRTNCQITTRCSGLSEVVSKHLSHGGRQRRIIF